MRPRTVLAFVLAPITVPAVFLALMAFYGADVLNVADVARGFVVFGAVGYGAALLFGLPLYVWFRSRGWNHFGAFAVAGGGVGGAVGAVLDAWAYHGMADTGFLFACVTAGLLAAVVFRIVRGWEPNLGVHPRAPGVTSRGGSMSDEEDEYQIEYLTREQAIAAAREQATRDLSESESVISYVAFVPGLEDFCRCEFRFEAPNGWVQSCRMLTPAERKPDEQITDDRIRAVAHSGDVISAIRLYRGKHGVGLAEGKAGVERLLRENP